MSRSNPITVCSLRDRGEPTPEDVVCTRPGPFGNPYPVSMYGWHALDMYRDHIRYLCADHQRGTTGLPQRAESLAGKRLLCACPSDALACHAWILAEEVAKLTGCGVVPAPGRERL